MTKIYNYKGLIVEKESEISPGIYLVREGRLDQPLAKEMPFSFQKLMVSIRYAISSTGNWPETLDEVAANEVSKLDGIGKAQHYDKYSEITGYLWTVEELKVGGHDLLQEIESHIGKYLWMEVIVHE